ncbi:MAG: hypothetical protein A2066_19670 [Bacteroidetes bacterium GWB2_41_8]|nr:MAG: hypothetical protein A2066_19670 [Bacteroidetes bacterium GWB2_41_8]
MKVYLRRSEKQKKSAIFWLTFICVHLVDVNETNYEMGSVFSTLKCINLVINPALKRPVFFELHDILHEQAILTVE